MDQEEPTKKNVTIEKIKMRLGEITSASENLVDKINLYEKSIYKSNLIIAILVTVVFISTGLMIINQGQIGEAFVLKSEIKHKIVTAITHKADLRAIKNIYQNRIKSKKDFSQLLSDMSEYFSSNYPLSNILEDMRTDLYFSDTVNIVLLDKFDKIITEHNAVNPFDILESTQKEYFENIRIKLGQQEYISIQTEIDNLVDELYAKNSLVTQYLNDASTSFWISITALAFAIIIGAFQIYQNRSNRLKLYFSSAIAEVLNENNEKKLDKPES